MPQIRAQIRGGLKSKDLAPSTPETRDALGTLSGKYSPDDESPRDPEDLGAWRIWYRIDVG